MLPGAGGRGELDGGARRGADGAGAGLLRLDGELVIKAKTGDCTIFSHGDSCMGCTDLYIEMRITYCITYLFKSAACGKHSKGTYKRYLARSS